LIAKKAILVGRERRKRWMINIGYPKRIIPERVDRHLKSRMVIINDILPGKNKLAYH